MICSLLLGLRSYTVKKINLNICTSRIQLLKNLLEHSLLREVNNFKKFVKDFETFFGTFRFFSGFWDFSRGFGTFFWDFFGKISGILGLFYGIWDFFWDFGTFWDFLKVLSKIFSSC